VWAARYRGVLLKGNDDINSLVSSLQVQRYAAHRSQSIRRGDEIMTPVMKSCQQQGSARGVKV